jgi:hypothetical protein
VRQWGGGVCLSTVEIVRHFFTVFHFGIGIELLYLSDVELSHSIIELKKRDMGI